MKHVKDPVSSFDVLLALFDTGTLSKNVDVALKNDTGRQQLYPLSTVTLVRQGTFNNHKTFQEKWCTLSFRKRKEPYNNKQFPWLDQKI